jgi:hypothetical protein
LRRGLALNLTIALVLGLGLGFLQANAGQLTVPVPPLALALAGAGVMGLIAGLTARLILRGWTGALQFLFSLLALLVWMAVAEATYAIWVGLRPFKYLAGADNWVEMGQLAIGCLSIIAVNLIGRRTRERVPLQWIWRSGDRSPALTMAKSPLKWGLGLSLAVAVGLGLSLGFLQANAGQLTVPVPPLALALAGAGVMGLLFGLTTCLILQGWTEALKLLVVLLALLVWMAVAEATYAVWAGLQPLEYLAEANNWVEMGQLTLGCLGAIVGGLARRRTSPAEVALAPQQVRDCRAGPQGPQAAPTGCRPPEDCQPAASGSPGETAPGTITAPAQVAHPDTPPASASEEKLWVEGHRQGRGPMPILSRRGREKRPPRRGDVRNLWNSPPRRLLGSGGQVSGAASHHLIRIFSGAAKLASRPAGAEQGSGEPSA